MPLRNAHGALGALLLFPLLPASPADLSKAVIVAPPSLTAPEKKAVAMLADEVEKRTRIRLPVSERWSGAAPAIIVCREPELRQVAGPLAGRLMPPASGAEGYRIQVIDGVALVVGNDPRGTLFGVGVVSTFPIVAQLLKSSHEDDASDEGHPTARGARRFFQQQ